MSLLKNIVKDGLIKGMVGYVVRELGLNRYGPASIYLCSKESTGVPPNMSIEGKEVQSYKEVTDPETGDVTHYEVEFSDGTGMTVSKAEFEEKWAEANVKNADAISDPAFKGKQHPEEFNNEKVIALKKGKCSKAATSTDKGALELVIPETEVQTVSLETITGGAKICYISPVVETGDFAGAGLFHFDYNGIASEVHRGCLGSDGKKVEVNSSIVLASPLEKYSSSKTPVHIGVDYDAPDDSEFGLELFYPEGDPPESSKSSTVVARLTGGDPETGQSQSVKREAHVPRETVAYSDQSMESLIKSETREAKPVVSSTDATKEGVSGRSSTVVVRTTVDGEKKTKGLKVTDIDPSGDTNYNPYAVTCAIRDQGGAGVANIISEGSRGNDAARVAAEFHNSQSERNGRIGETSHGHSHSGRDNDYQKDLQPESEEA